MIAISMTFLLSDIFFTKSSCTGKAVVIFTALPVLFATGLCSYQENSSKTALSNSTYTVFISPNCFFTIASTNSFVRIRVVLISGSGAIG